MNADVIDDDDLNKDEDEYNRIVLLQAKQRRSNSLSNQSYSNRSRTVVLSAAAAAAAVNDRISAEADASDTLLSLSSADQSPSFAARDPPVKRARLSFPPEKYADLEVTVVSNLTHLQTPRLTYR